MGKGDKKTKRGKIVNKSYGVRRQKKTNKAVHIVEKQEIIKPEEVEVKKATPKRKTTKKVEPKATE